MPTDRFYRLPEAKKQVIREAAIQEFARVPFEKASINQIIHNADISRGSFYTYFEDKQDVVKFIFEDIGKETLTACEEILNRNGGDFIDMFLKLFDRAVDTLQETRTMLEVVRNVFSYEQNAQIFGMDGCPEPGVLKMEREDHPVRWIYDRIDRSRLYSQQVEDFLTLITMGMATVLLSIKQYYQYPERVDTIRDMLRRSMDILRRGAYKPA